MWFDGDDRLKFYEVISIDGSFGIVKSFAVDMFGVV